MTTLALCLLLNVAPVPASTYFPTAEGSTWTYEEAVNGLKDVITDRVLAPIKLGGVEGVVPIATSGATVPTEKTYYRVEGDSVWTVAYDGGRLMEKPVPVFVVGDKKKEWSFKGNVQFLRESAQLDLKGNSKPGPEIEVLGTKRKTLLIEVTGTLTPQSGNKVVSTQFATYAENVGLISFEQRAELNGFKVVRTRRLLKFEGGVPRSQ